MITISQMNVVAWRLDKTSPSASPRAWESLSWHALSQGDGAQHDPSAVFEAGIRNHHIANTAYPISHGKTMSEYRLSDPKEQEKLVVRSWERVEEMGLYVHIPFCEQRCSFCEYTVVDPTTVASSEDRYFDFLEKEFELYARIIHTKTKKLVGFDIGGGTPSLAKTENIRKVIELAKKHFHLPEDVLISIETTPKIAANHPEKIQAFYDMGIRRISMGVQTISPKVLEFVGRLNTTVDWNIAAAENIRAAGFKRFNIDIMYGMYGQNMENIRATLQHILALNPEFVTLYRTRYKGTKIADHADNVTLEDANIQGSFLKEALLDAGYQGRNGKNTFSKIEGDVGTSDYLTRRVIDGMPYLGLWLGAQSYNLRYLSYNLGAAEKAMKRYTDALDAGKLPIQDIYHLSLPASVAKFVSVSFYFGGVDFRSFRKNFGVSFGEYFPGQTAFVLENGYMECCNHGIYLTKKGVENYNGVISLFYAPAVQEYLLGK